MKSPKSTNSLLHWLLQDPIPRLGGGILFPFVLLLTFILLLLYQPNSAVSRADGKIEIEYWEKWSGFEAVAAAKLVAAFNQKQDKIHVNFTLQGDIEEKTKVAAAGGNPPDVVGLYSRTVPVFAEQNALLPLDELLAAAGVDSSRYVPVYWKMCRYAGKTWVLPTTPATVALHWNKRLFRAAGLDPEKPPRTIAELDEFARKLTQYDEHGNLTQMGFLPNEPGWWAFCWGWWFGGQLWDEKSRVTVNSPENIAAMEWVQSYPQKYGLEKLVAFKGTFGSFSSADNAFMSNKIAMVLQGVWMANFIQTYAPEMEWGAAPFPSVSLDLPNVTFAEADVIGIPNGSKHPREAFEFLKFLATPEGIEIINLEHQKNSPLREVSAEFLTAHPNPKINVFTELGYSPNARLTPGVSIWLEFDLEMRRAFDAVWNLNATPKTALDMAQARLQRRLDYELARKKVPGK
jgi:ABC-type glycerol-3-phosphate transport system substrate-binding protein